MSSARYIVGDSLAVLKTLPDASVDLVCSSPPFLALRSYLPADHPDKAHEIGSEATPGEFLDVLLDVVVECRRVLAPHGSLVFELGDTYSGSGGAGGDYNEGGLRDGQSKFEAHRTVETIGWSDCGHDDYRNGVVLDCFAGSGTTLEVATGHGRDAIGIDLDERNAELALERVGPLLLTIERGRGFS